MLRCVLFDTPSSLLMQPIGLHYLNKLRRAEVSDDKTGYDDPSTAKSIELNPLKSDSAEPLKSYYEVILQNMTSFMIDIIVRN